MAEEVSNQLIKLALGLFVIVAIAAGIYIFFSGGVTDWLKSLGGSSMPVENTDFSKVTEPKEEIISFNYPVFEYKDRRFRRNLFYTFTDSWKFSDNKQEWADVDKYIPELTDKDYSQGLKFLIDKTISQGNERVWLKPILSTKYVDMNSNKEFSLSYKKTQADPSKTFVFKFENGKWLWKSPSAGLDWADKIAVAGFFGEPTDFVEKMLTIDEFYEGGEILFTEGNTLQ